MECSDTLQKVCATITLLVDSINRFVNSTSVPLFVADSVAQVEQCLHEMQQLSIVGIGTKS